MKESVSERLKEAIEPNKEKENLGHVTLHQARELIQDAGAVLLDVRPPAKVQGENAQEALHLTEAGVKRILTVH